MKYNTEGSIGCYMCRQQISVMKKLNPLTCDIWGVSCKEANITNSY